MGNLTRITKFKHFSGLTTSASKSLPNSTANRYAQGVVSFPEIRPFKNRNQIILNINL